MFKETGGPFHVAEWEETDLMEEAPEIEMQSHVTNFLDFADNAEVEIKRHVDKGFAILMD